MSQSLLSTLSIDSVPQPCHFVRSTTANDGSPQSRCAVHLGSSYSRRDLGKCAADHVRPYKAALTRRPTGHGGSEDRRGGKLSCHGMDQKEVRGVGAEPFGIPGSSRSGDPYPATPLGRRVPRREH